MADNSIHKGVRMKGLEGYLIWKCWSFRMNNILSIMVLERLCCYLKMVCKGHEFLKWFYKGHKCPTLSHNYTVHAA